MISNIDLIGPIPKASLEEVCTKYHIQHLSLFGSVLHRDSKPSSDLDILVEFEKGYIPGFAFAAIQRELSQILGRRVDLHTPPSLSPYFREEVMKEAQAIYDAAGS